jgi:hypothetical protein
MTVIVIVLSIIMMGLFIVVMMEMPPGQGVVEVRVPIIKEVKRDTFSELEEMYDNIGNAPGTIIHMDSIEDVIYKPRKRRGKMKITEFNNKLSRNQKGGKGNKVSIADIAELVRTIRKMIKESQGVDIYTIIKRM